MTARAARRTVLRLAGAAMLAPLAAAIARAADPPRFAPPAGRMLYSRRLERDLADGARFVVRRDFSVRFRREPDGFLVEGEQSDVEVEAPEALATFAAIERERVEHGLFPLRLDAQGRIAGGIPGSDGPRLEAAVREALDRIDSRPRAPAERAELVQFVNAVHQNAGRVLTELPVDLFAPPATPRSETREIALPGGGAGTVTVTFRGSSDPATGLMREAIREVVTQLAGDRRQTRETWHLTPPS